MKRAFLHRLNNLTARHDSQHYEVLFFVHPHFFLILRSRSIGTLPFARYRTKPDKGAKVKEPNFTTLQICCSFTTTNKHNI